MFNFLWTRKQIKIIKKSCLFDADFYKNQINIGNYDPIKHYIKIGWRQGLNPCKDFDTNFYINTYNDVKKSNLNPLVHFIKIGSKEGRKPNKTSITNYDIQSNNFIQYQKHKPLDTGIKLIAFYLPQFHPFPENDLWWGKGFTEWTNVTKAIPNFKGHYQPHLPIHNGFYDLRIPEIMIEQAKLAKNYGIYGFNFYYYWFDGKILMHKPFEILLEHKEIDINFCITWANENWTRTWDGQEKEILIEQNHSIADSRAFIKSLYKFFNDQRYIKIDNKPVLIIYRADLIPNLTNIVQMWRDEVKKAGYDGLYIMCTNATRLKKINIEDFDAIMEFPPHNIPQPPIMNEIVFSNKNFSGNIYDYQQVVKNKINIEEPNYKLFKTAMLSWDNTARRQDNGTIFHNFSLKDYEKWLNSIIAHTKNNKKLNNDEKIVFINAWNEWAEGTHLEPDRKYGYGYLETTYMTLKNNLN